MDLFLKIFTIIAGAILTALMVTIIFNEKD